MSKVNFHACTCKDRKPGSAFIEPLPGLAGGERALLECKRCSGKLIVLNDGMHRVVIEAPTASTLLAYFAAWLREAADETGSTPEAIAEEIGKPWGKTHSFAACSHCIAVRAEPDVKGLEHVASGEGWDRLYKCPECGAYRWKTFETHGFADVEVWGKPTRDDLKQFESYFNQVGRERGVSREAILEVVFQRCV